ncbi:DoxX family protein [Aquimarina litoralis]|uniref:DoxX family protein n=1 Tax=Aquimarina litoralis TaxID=584605 RepID=UPI001C58B65E|nr:DoxX family protein [Aquimarina litoralis]MBW1297631.1 DoxX family membrane protein [Aquimarina litoralis]
MKNVIKKIIQPITMNHWSADLLFAFPRIVCGYFLAVNFGGSKFGVPWSPEGSPDLGFLEVVEWFPKDIAEYGGIFAMFPVFFAWMGAASEAIGGVFLALGFKTRVASFFILCTMLVAIIFQKWDQGLWGMLPAMGFLWISIYNLILGSGRFGIDYLLTKKWTLKINKGLTKSFI